MRWLALRWLAGAGLALCGCERAPSWSLAYESALSRWAEGAAEGAAEASAEAGGALPREAFTLPDLRDRALPPAPALTLSARDLLGVSTCELGPLLAARNGPLGRVMTGSQGLLYEARFLTYAPRCVAPARVRAALDEATAAKRARWGEVLWRATWSGRDLSLFFSASYPRDRRPPPLSASDEGALRWLGELSGWAEAQGARGEAEARAALARLERDLEPTFQALTPHAGGRALAEAAEARDALTRWVATLKAHASAPTAATAPTAPTAPTAQECERLNALIQTYATTAQPELSRRAQAITRLAAASEGLIALLPASPPQALHALFETGLSSGERGLAAQLRALSREHARVLEGLRGRCVRGI